jgi:hypothetical protein
VVVVKPMARVQKSFCGEHQRLADPVGLVDDAQAVGVAVSDEDAEGERGHLIQNDKSRQELST